MSNDLHRSALPPGHRLHWYIIERVLGQGGFGITYLVRDENLDQAVAIKEYLPSEIAVRSPDGAIQPRSGADAEQYRLGLEKFLTEARTLARFNHPNIIQVFSVFEANHTAYMVMRYEDGESLRTILKQRKHLAEDELLGVVVPICDGLTKVHAAGFIHRDIQPSNIYIRDDATPVLLDFGAARRTMGNPRTLTILVAPGYAPIEQYYSSGAEQGPWTDIYGLGATLYRAVAGTAPIDAIERSRGMLGNSRDMLVPAGVVGNGRYSDQFLRAIDHALKFNDKERPRSVNEWIVELHGGPVPVSPAVIAGAQPEAVRHEHKAPMPPPAVPSAARPGPPSLPAVAPPGEARYRWVIATVATVAVAAGAWLLMPQILAPKRDARTDAAAPGQPVQEHKTTGTPAPGPGAVVAPATVSGPVVNHAADATTRDEVAAEDGITPPPEPGQPVVGRTAVTPTPSPSAVPGKETPDPDLTHSKAELAALREQLRSESARLAALQQDVQTLRTTQQANPVRADAPPQDQGGKLVAPPSGPAPATEPTSHPDPDALQAGLGALAAGNFESALQMLLPLARSGNAAAQYNVALLYRNGQGVLANNATALDWLRKAAWQKYPEAQVALARLYAEGIDGKRDYFLSYVWYLAAERNGVFASMAERSDVEKQVQPEQLPQASALALRLNRAAPGLAPVSTAR